MVTAMVNDGDNDESILPIALDAGRRPAITREGRLCSTPNTYRVGGQIALLRGGRPHTWFEKREISGN
jgi:hypothetical protein